MKNSITLKKTVIVAASPEYVWDYTQNYNNRKKWDWSVLEAIVLATKPNRVVKLKLRGGTIMTFVYKLDRRPERTSLVIKDVRSPIIKEGGGSWTYVGSQGYTIWTQTHTIIFKEAFIHTMMIPLYKIVFGYLMIAAMKEAKSQIENM